MSLTKNEFKSTLVVSLIFSLRLFGLFVLLPIFSLYASEYENSSAFLAGIALGIYSLSQALMQVPMGFLSDKFGRKKIVMLGLIMFIFGSLICYFSKDINTLIVGRLIQGLGAISSIGIATLSENTSVNNRASAFTIMGISVGGAFIIGFIIGPFFASIYSFKSIFILLFILGFIATIVTYLYYPNDKNEKINSTKIKYNNNLTQIYLGSFFLSLILSMMLYTYPLTWNSLGATKDELPIIYLYIFLPAVLFIYPLVRYFEKIKKIDKMVKAGWFFLVLGYLIYLIAPKNNYSLYALGILFFFGSSVFNSILPSLLTFNIPNNLKATSTGPFYLMNFLGHAIGALIAGLIYMKESYLGIQNSLFIYFISILIVIIWIKIDLPEYKENNE